MGRLLRSVADTFSSLKLTVVLLALGIILVVIATLDQVNLGIWAVQAKYFRSFVVVTRWPGTNVALPIFPGGYLVGGLLLVNLLCAQFARFTLTWRNLGLHLTHFGIILLLVGELITGLTSVESDMILDTGGTRNFLEEKFGRELAIVDVTDSGADRVWTVPLERLTKREAIALPGCPFTVQPTVFHENAQLFNRNEAPNAPTSGATAGLGTRVVLQPLAPTYRTDEENVPTALVEFRTPDRSLGKWLVSFAINQPQAFTHEGRTYEVMLRRTRIYLDFALTLLEFRHDKYPGTDIPRNFSSQVKLVSADAKENREVRIFMNNPLRHGGYTFYQAGFKNDDRTTILQVMRNPGWLMPYIACVMSSFGLALHFCILLGGFIARRRTANWGGDPGQPSLPRSAQGGAA